MNDTWSNLIAWLSDNVPYFLQIGSCRNWWSTTLQVLFWLGIYIGIAWIYFKVIGYPIWKIISHFYSYGAKVMPWWQGLIYIFIGIYCTTGGTIISFEERIFDITPVIALLPILIYYIVKVKWRVVYFHYFKCRLFYFG